MSYRCSRDHNRAVELAQKLLEREPDSFFLRRAVAMDLAWAGRADEAIAATHRLIELGDARPATLGIVYSLLGRKKEAERLLAEIDELERRQLTRKSVEGYA
ncbi:MAG: hypothetical protein ACREAM_28075, partial [Blastocatellia bacterium]